VENHRILRNAMIENGFRPVVEEWWHFPLDDEPYPHTYFDFSITFPMRRGES
jgi:D-alanyl-D-alanine dipeptidase